MSCLKEQRFFSPLTSGQSADCLIIAEHILLKVASEVLRYKSFCLRLCLRMKRTVRRVKRPSASLNVFSTVPVHQRHGQQQDAAPQRLLLSAVCFGEL